MRGVGLLVDVITGVMLTVAAVGAIRLVLGGWLRMPSDRLVDGSHLTMGLGMAVMLSPGLVPGGPQWPWVALAAGWLGLSAASVLLGRDRTEHAHHAVAAGGMLLMWLAMSPLGPVRPEESTGTAHGGMPGMEMRTGGGLNPTSFLALALFALLVYRAAGLVGRVGLQEGPAEGPRTASGPAGQRNDLGAAGPVARIMTPIWSHGCEVMMSLAMAGMLYLLV